MIEGVWGGRIVSDSALTTRLNAVRKVVNDSGAEQRIIRTVPRRGVPFFGEVTEDGDLPALAEVARSAPSRRSRRLPIVVLPFVNLRPSATLQRHAIPAAGLSVSA